ncbi:MAG: FliH/SctL family protein [Gammaproteobacteria bacterium]
MADGSVVTPFELPAVEGLIVTDAGGKASMPTAGQLEAMHKQAYEEGFAAGQAEGYQHGEQLAAADAARRVAMLDTMLGELVEPLARFDDELVDTIAELALLIARHMVRRELRADPGEVVGVVRETLRHLPVASRATTVKLNPDDVDLVREALSLGDEGSGCRLSPDPLITRGGCVIDTETSRIDATVEGRLAAIASRMFGGEREGDRND